MATEDALILINGFSLSVLVASGIESVQLMVSQASH